MSRYLKFDVDFKRGAVGLVEETGRPIAQVARELGVKPGTLGNWVATPGGRTVSAHAAERIVQGAPGRPPTTLERGR